MSVDTSLYHYVIPEVVSELASEDPFAKTTQQATRAAYAASVIELAKQNPKVVVLNADVAKSLGTNKFADEFPDREFNFGIAEQNMFAAAAGMATTGLIPFASTYAVFASMRALDQVRNSIHYPNLNVKIAAGHSGITPGPDGVTHQAQEDLSLIRALANSTIIAMADCPTTRQAVFAAAEYEGPVYLSFTRDPVPVLFDDRFPFEIGKAVTIRDGQDVTIIAMRDLVCQALVAAERLAQDEGVSAKVVYCHTIKPLDIEMVLQSANDTGAIVVAENNVKYGGLGSAVAEVLVANNPIPMRQIGVNDTFAESGPYLEIIDKYGLSSPHIIKATQDVLEHKKRFGR